MKKEKDEEGQISPFFAAEKLMYSEGEIFKAFLSPSTFPLSPNLESCTHAYFPFTHFQFLKIFPLLRRPPPPTLQNILERRGEVGEYFFLIWDAAS